MPRQFTSDRNFMLGRPRSPSIRISVGLFVSVPPRNHSVHCPQPCHSSCGILDRIEQSNEAPVVTEDAAAEEDAYTQPLSRTYLLAHPLLMTERERKLRLMLSGPRADEPVAPINHLGHLRKLATAEGHAAYIPNNDTLYTGALVESKEQPMILHARRSARCFALQRPECGGGDYQVGHLVDETEICYIICLKEPGRQIRAECWKGGEWDPSLLREGLVAACAPGAVRLHQ